MSAINFQKIHIGTAGWNYKHWRGPFYPGDLPPKQWPAYYMEHFHTVEVNNTFYQLPEKETFGKWKQTAPEGFIYSVKASRYITHMKKLKDPGEPVSKFLDHAGALGEKLGPVLFQLPPRWKCNLQRLAHFLGTLPRQFRFAFEFRDPSWWDPGVFEILSQYNAAFCAFDLEGRQSPVKLTADFAYIRLHGPGPAYAGQYSDGAVSEWAGLFQSLLDKGIEVFCYFDNDENGYAAKDALRLREKIGQHSSGAN